MRYGWLLGVVVAALATVAAACGGSSEGSAVSVQSKELNLFTWTQYVPPQVIRGFEQEHPGLEVNVSYYTSNEEMLAGVLAHPATYDLVIPSDYTVEAMIEQDLLEPIDVEKDLSNFENVERDFRAPFFDPGSSLQSKKGKEPTPKYTVPYQWGTTGIAYDSSKVSDPPKEWADLARPEFRGKVALIDDAREVIGAGLLVNGYSKDDSNEADLQKAAAWVRSLDPLPINADNPEVPLENGSAIVSIMYNGNAIEAIRKNPAIRYVLPSNGGIWFDNLAIPNDAPHRDAALAFIDYVLEPKVAAEISRTYDYSTPNAAALDILATTNPALVRLPAFDPPRDALQGLLLTKNVGVAGALRFDSVWKEFRR